MECVSAWNGLISCGMAGFSAVIRGGGVSLSVLFRAEPYFHAPFALVSVVGRFDPAGRDYGAARRSQMARRRPVFTTGPS